MPHMHQLCFTGLELKGLWVRLTGGSMADDPVLQQATENALDKIYRAEKGMKRAAPPKPESAKRRGPELDTRRRRTGESAA
jgi:hypothetical protein